MTPTPEETKAKIHRIAAVDGIASEVKDELLRAMDNFAPFNSAHEGHSVIEEEFDELWDEIKLKQGARDVEAMRKEAIQVAAMAMRFIHDVCDKGQGQK